MGVDAKPGDLVELAHKDTGFTDPETGFDISRDAQVELGPSIGQKTQVALASGALLLVSGKSKKTGLQGGQADKDELPADMPGRDAFIAAGFTKLTDVKAIKEEDLTQIKGIGAKTVEALTAWSKEQK